MTDLPIRFVLVETSHPGNIGAVARAMKNMGLSDLVLVNPREFPHPEATTRASGADERATPLLASLTPAALTALSGAYWPGNLDHLHSVVSNMQVLRGEITADMVKRLLGESASPNQVLAPEITTRFFELPLREAREAFERIYFEQLLGREQSNMSKVAEKAGLERTHLYRKLKQLNIRFSRRTDESAAG